VSDAVESEQPHDPVALAAELCNPRRHQLDRDPVELASALGELDDDDRAADRRLRARHADALRRPRQPGQARRALSALREHRTVVAARRASLSARDVEVPSLLDQVVDAIESSSGSGHRSSSGPSRSPIGLAAAALVGDIEREVGHHGPRAQLGHAVWTWVAGAPVSAGQGGPAAGEVLARWVARAHQVINPPRPVELAAACPQCGTRTVRAPDDSGQVVLRPALQIDRVSGMVTCAASWCRASWGPELWEFLARVLAHDPAGVDGQREPAPTGTGLEPAPRRTRTRAGRRAGGLTPATPVGDHPAREG
jgi:hypothetical protein